MDVHPSTMRDKEHQEIGTTLKDESTTHFSRLSTHTRSGLRPGFCDAERLRDPVVFIVFILEAVLGDNDLRRAVAAAPRCVRRRGGKARAKARHAWLEECLRWPRRVKRGATLPGKWSGGEKKRWWGREGGEPVPHSGFNQPSQLSGV